jgi:hypothetical protein
MYVQCHNTSLIRHYVLHIIYIIKTCALSDSETKTLKAVVPADTVSDLNEFEKERAMTIKRNQLVLESLGLKGNTHQRLPFNSMSQESGSDPEYVPVGTPGPSDSESD